jgi:hypothetical protein
MAKNVHVVFGQYAKSRLEDSFSVAPRLAGEVFSLGDDLRIGPIAALDTPEGFLERKNWLETVDDGGLAFCFNTEGYSDHMTIESIRQVLLNGQVIHIWFGGNSFDLLALGRLISAIQPFAKQLILVPVSESIQVSLRGELTFIPKMLGVLRTEQVPSMEKHFRSPTDQELKTFSAIWSTACLRAESLRMVDVKGIFQDNVADKINQVLVSFCKAEYQVSARVVGETLVAFEFNVNDAALNWMLKELVVTGKLEAKGMLKEMKDYEVRLIKNHL